MSSSTVMMMSAIMATTLTMMFSSMEEKKKEKKEEKMSFECGFSNVSPIKMSFSTNFIMIIIMFLVFDIEVSIMIPMVMMEKMKEEQMMMASMFLVALTLILLKEWDLGTIDWNR